MFNRSLKFQQVPQLQSPTSEIQTSYSLALDRISITENGNPSHEPELSVDQHHPQGLWSFLRQNPYIIAAVCCGVAMELASFGFTFWLSLHKFLCPTWAFDCKVPTSVMWTTENYELVQAIISTVTSIGLSCLAYAVFKVGETTLWPVIADDSYSFEDLDCYITAAQGSILAILKALYTFKSGSARLVLLITVVTCLMIQGNSIVVGFVYTRQNVTNEYISQHKRGGTLGFAYVPNSWDALPVYVGAAFDRYTAWSNGWVDEPMPDYRDFIVNREALSIMGDLSVRAIRVQKNIACNGSNITILQDPSGSVNNVFEVATASNSPVRLRLVPRLSVWTHSIQPINASRAITNLVFVAINGSIEGGDTFRTSEAFAAYNIFTMSAVMCSVDVNLFEDEFVIGKGGPKFTTLTSESTIVKSGSASLEQLAVWFGAMTTVSGLPLNDAQPMFELVPNTSLAIQFTSRNVITLDNDWKINDLKNFINVSAGALALSMNSGTGHKTLVSRLPVAQVTKARSFILLAPTLIILISMFGLAALNAKLHNSRRIPAMRPASIEELISSSQTNEIKRATQGGEGSASRVSTLRSLKVSFGADSNDNAVLGSKEHVRSFSKL